MAEYVAAQGVEKALADAVAQVIREKPGNAIARLSQILGAPDPDIPLGKWNIISGNLPADAPAFEFTSKVVGKGKQYEDFNWMTTAWLVPHEALRWLMSITTYMSEHKNFDPCDPKKAAAFKVWFDDMYYPYIDSHHGAEEAVCGKHWPDLFGKETSVSGQHAEVAVMMNEMKALVSDMAEGKDAAAAGKAFVEKHTKFVADLLPHLEHEEREMPTILEAWAKGEGEYNTIMGTELLPYDMEKGAAAFGPEKYMGEIFPLIMAVILASMAEWGGVAMVKAAMWDIMPPPVKDGYLSAAPAAVHRVIVLPLTTCVAPKA